MNTVAIVQARIGSTRLKGKVLKEVCGKPLLWHLLSRLKYSKRIKKIVVAIPTLKQDDIIEKNVRKWGFDVFRGDPNDLLDRYYKAARKFKADPIVRITADCPLIDPKIVDKVIGKFSSGKFDLVKTDETFPDGLDTAVYSFSSIEKAWKEAKLPSEREHVGPYIINHPELFKIKTISFKEKLGHMRWSVDEDRDYKFIKKVFEKLSMGGKIFCTNDVLRLLRKEPELQEINKNIIRDEGYLKSLKEDKEFFKKRSKLKISRLCLGTAQLGMRYGINNESGKPDLEESKSIIDLAIKNRIDAFDTAPVYGNSEEVLGKCLEKHDKDKLVLISKLPAVNWSKDQDEILENVRETVKKTLNDLDIRRLPVYLFHKYDDIEKNGFLIMNELKSLRAKGLICKIGVSIYTPYEAERSLNIDDIEAIQVPFNLIDKRLLKNGFLKRAKKKGLLIFARSVFLQGLFFKKDIPDNLKAFVPYQKEINRICGDIDLSIEELALAYALSIGDIDSVVIGAETAGQLKINIETAKKIKLSGETLKKIEKLGSAPEIIINPSLWGKHGQ